jgi:hypothetical protein
VARLPVWARGRRQSTGPDLGEIIGRLDRNENPATGGVGGVPGLAYDRAAGVSGDGGAAQSAKLI